MTGAAPLLEVRGVSKQYGGNYALEPIDLTIRAGSVHGFLGKNGAGKSTLVSIIAGQTKQTSGQIFFEGVDISSKTYAERKEMGIHLLPQHAEVLPELSVAENLLLPDFKGAGRGLIRFSKVNEYATSVLERYRLPFAAEAMAGTLTLHDQRRLSIARTLKDGGKLVMLDEPTASLGKQERRELFDWIRELNAAGQSFVFISHYNSEIREICDECAVLRDGVLVADALDPRVTSSEEISRLVTGVAHEEFVRDRQTDLQPLLEVHEARAPGFRGVSLSIGAGEILGLVGLPGSGAKEFARALGGLNPLEAGTVRLRGETVDLHRVASARKAGVCYMTDDRIHEGLVADLSVMENLHLGNWPTKSGLVDAAQMGTFYERIHDRVVIRAWDPSQPVGELSGGNQQKVLLGSVLGFDPQVVVFDEPTIGVDVGAKEEIHSLMDELTRQGAAVVVLTYDADEMCRIVDRAVAFSDGAVVTELAGDELTPDRVLSSISTQKVSS
ncbi:sugar ABC transporter ATP-binding protein [Leucobacter komagatae]|uniref:sugar ABC transporter ATP-binding protein n=1 Tax=Leucobacter komagatae TaxID=55969 RepID=UPI0018DEBF1B|nr:sugar ABC transporter ATP-binding protein [Leucobacter komagatae]